MMKGDGRIRAAGGCMLSHADQLESQLADVCERGGHRCSLSSQLSGYSDLEAVPLTIRSSCFPSYSF